MQDPSHVVDVKFRLGALQARECCDHPTQQIPVDIRGIGCRSREDPFPDRGSLQRVFLIQRHCQKPAQEPDLPFRVQIVNNVGKHEPHKLNSTSRFFGMESLYLDARSAAQLRNFAAVSSVTCDSKSSSSSDSISVPYALLESMSSMKENTVDAQVELASSLAT